MKNKTIKLHKDNSERGGDVYGKILVLTFEDSEEEILNHIISCVSMGVRAFQVIENTKTNLSFNGLEIDDINRSVRKQKQEIDLTFTEFEILYLLANNPGRVFSKEQIYDIVWKESYSGDYNIIMSHIRNIREKIEDNPSRDTDFADNIGIIIETPGFLSSYTGFKNLEYLASIKNVIGKKEIQESMERVGLDPNSKKKVGKYSLGMRQRLGIAQAIMENPDILILDEPMNGLDNQGVEEVRGILLNLRDEGKAIILASHNKEDIEVLCDEVYEMDHGKLTASA